MDLILKGGPAIKMLDGHKSVLRQVYFPSPKPYGALLPSPKANLFFNAHCLIVAIASLSPSSSTPSPVLRGRNLVFQVQSHKQELLVFLQIVLIVMPTMETNIRKKPTISRADFKFCAYQVQSRMVVSCPSRPH